MLLQLKILKPVEMSSLQLTEQPSTPSADSMLARSQILLDPELPIPTAPPPPPSPQSWFSKITKSVKDWHIPMKMEIHPSEEVHNLLRSTAQSTEKISKKLSNVLYKIDSNLDELTTLHTVETIVSLITGIIAIWRAPDYTTKALIIASLAAAHHIFSTVKTKELIESISRWHVAQKDVPHAQGKTDHIQNGPASDETFLKMFTKLIAHSCGFGDIDSKADEARAKKLGALGSAVRTVSDLTNYIYKAIKYAFEWIYEKYYGYPYSFRNEQDIIKDINTIIYEANHIRSESNNFSMLADTMYYRKLLDLGIIMDEIDERAKVSALSIAKQHNYTSAALTVRKQIAACGKALLNGANRRRPVVIYLFGTPEVGKTGIREWLCSELAPQVYKKIFTNDMFFEAPPDTTDFWDGYTPTAAFYSINDCFQNGEAEKRTNKAAEIIHLADDTPYVVNMANVDLKGNVPFVSEFIFITANVLPLSDLKLASKEAFCRRIDFFVHVNLKEGKTLSKTTDVDWSIWDLHVEKPQWYLNKKNRSDPKHPDIKKSDPITKEELVKNMIELHAARGKNSTSLRKQAELRSKLRLAEISKNEPEFLVHNDIRVIPHVQMLKAAQNLFWKSEPEPFDLKKCEYIESRPKSVSPSHDCPPEPILKPFFEIKHEKTQIPYIRENPFMHLFGAIVSVIGVAFLGKKLFDYATTHVTMPKGVSDMGTEASVLLHSKVNSAQEYLDIAKQKIASALDTSNLPIFSHSQAAYDNGKMPKKNLNHSISVRRPKPVVPSVQGKKLPLDIVPILSESYFSCTAIMKDTSEYAQYGMFVCDRFALMTKHFLEVVLDQNCSILRIITSRGEFKFVPSELHVCLLEECDDGLVDFPNTIPQFRDILHFFIQDDDLDDAVTAPVTLLLSTGKNRTSIITGYNIEFEPQQSYYLDEAQGITMNTINVLRITTPDYEPPDGICGSVYLSAQTKSQSRVILGNHFAGVSHFGYCQIITQQTLLECIELLKTTRTPHAQGKKARFIPPSNLNIIRTREPYESPRQPTKTQIQPSLLHEKIVPIQRAPALLAPNETQSPASLALMKAVKPNKKMIYEDKLLYLEACKLLLEDLPYHPRPVLDLESALNRPSGYHHISPVYLDTSCGLGVHNWSLHHKNGKIDFMEVDSRGHRSPKLLLEDAVDALIEALLTGTARCICQDCLKDELRLLEKILAAKTRLFSALPVEWLALYRMLFSPLIEAAMRSSSHHPFKLGLNPHSAAWKVKYDNTYSTEYRKKHATAGDIASQDATTSSDQSECNHLAYLDWFEKQYSDEQKNKEFYYLTKKYCRVSFAQIQTLRANLLKSVDIERHHVFMNIEYAPGHGNASGKFLTTFDNCTNSGASISCSAYWYAVEILKIPITLRRIIKEVLKMNLFGDDNENTHDETIDGFGMGPMAHYFKSRIGYTLTDFRKGDIVVDPDTLQPMTTPNVYTDQEVFFLKRYNKVMPSGDVYAPMNLLETLDITNWCSKKLTVEEGTVVAAEACIMELYHHGRHVFDKYTNIINRELKCLNLPQINITYNDMFAQFHAMKRNHKPHTLRNTSFLFEEDFDFEFNEPIPHIQMKRIPNQNIDSKAIILAQMAEALDKLDEDKDKNIAVKSELQTLIINLEENNRKTQALVATLKNAIPRIQMQKKKKNSKRKSKHTTYVHDSDEENSLEYQHLQQYLRDFDEDEEHQDIAFWHSTREYDHGDDFHPKDADRLANESKEPQRFLTTKQKTQKYWVSPANHYIMDIKVYEKPIQPAFAPQGYAYSHQTKKIEKLNSENLVYLGTTPFVFSHPKTKTPKPVPHIQFDGTRKEPQETVPDRFSPQEAVDAFFEMPPFEPRPRRLTRQQRIAQEHITLMNTFRYSFEGKLMHTLRPYRHNLFMYTMMWIYILGSLPITTALAFPVMLVLVAIDQVLKKFGSVNFHPLEQAETLANNPYYQAFNKFAVGWVYSSMLLSAFTIQSTSPPSAVIMSNYTGIVPYNPTPPSLFLIPHIQMKKEQAQKSKQGVISGVAEGLSTIAYSVQSLPVIGGLASKAMPALSLIGGFAKSFGLDMPSNVSSVNRVINDQSSGFANVKGLDTVQQLGCDPANQVMNDPSVFCEKNGPHMNFDNYKLRPGLVATVSFDGSYVQNQTIVDIPIHPMYCTDSVVENSFAITPLANYASYFRYWRGSMKYMLQFTTSKFISTRVRVEWLPDPSFVNTMVNSDSGDIVSLTIDVCGDADAPFTIPYLKLMPWSVNIPPHMVRSSDSNDWLPASNGVFVVRVINPPVVNGSTYETNVDLAIWLSGGEDFQVARPEEIWENYAFSTTSTPAKKKSDKKKKHQIIPHIQMSKGSTLQTQFQTAFPPIGEAKQYVQDNLIQGETVVSFPELFHRYTDLGGPFNGAAVSLDQFKTNPFIPDDLEDRGSYARFLYSFNFHRGNTRVKYIHLDTAVVLMSVANAVTDGLEMVNEWDYQAPRERAGTAIVHGTFRPTIEAEMPYYGIFPFVSLMCSLEQSEWPCNIFIVQQFGSDPAVVTTFIEYIATGDNYMCGWCTPPGYFIYTPPGKKYHKKVDPNRNLPRIQMLKQDGHGLEERQVTETTITENKELSGFRDTVGVKAEVAPVTTTPVHQNSDPYASQGLSAVLSRPYLVQSIDWSGSSAIGALLYQGNYPADLFLISNVAEKLNRFKYFRAGVHVEVRLNSTTFHSGKLLILFSPHYNTTNLWTGFKFNDMYTEAGHLETISMSAMANETVSFDIPYVAPSTYYDLGNDPTLDEFRGFIGMFKLYVLSPLKLVGSTTTPSIVVSIYANFIDPQVAGFTPGNISLTRVIKKKNPKQESSDDETKPSMALATVRKQTNF
jgi:hypothetical protein